MPNSQGAELDRVMNRALSPVTFLGGGRIAVSVPSRDADEALGIWEAGEGTAVPSLSAASFSSVQALQDETARCLLSVPVLSVALGGGADVWQWIKVLAAGEAGAPHLNQPFTTAPFAKGRFPGMWVNGVVEPTEAIGRVHLTGVRGPLPVIDVQEAAKMLLDGQVDALKLHPTDPADDFRATMAIATGAAEAGVAAFEPAGNLDLTSTPQLVERLMAVPDLRVLPHVFSALLDRTTGRVDLGRVRALIADLRLAVGGD